MGWMHGEPVFFAKTGGFLNNFTATADLICQLLDDTVITKTNEDQSPVRPKKAS